MEKVYVAALEEIREGEFLLRECNGRKVLLSRVNGQICAIENRCPHLGLPLAKGKICEGVVTCPFHGSSFDMLTGENLDWTNAFLGMPLPQWSHRIIAMGKGPQAVKIFDIECEGEQVFLRL